jgi:predicted HicB family RNase H-like nuclease
MTTKVKDLKQTNIRVNPELWKQVKIKSAEKGKSMQDFVSEVLQKAVK